MKEGKITFDFNFDDAANNISSSSNSYEDIISSSQYVSREGVNAGRKPTSHAKAKATKKPINKSKIYRIKKWWKCMKKGKKAALISVASLFLVICMTVIWFFSYFNYNYAPITENPEELGFTEVIDDKIVNIALFGIDTRNLNTFKGNSDSIMILSLNTKTKKIKIISVMRDSLVPIVRKGKTTYYKINAAYSWGGPELAISTLNTVFKLDISEYATVNFYGMVDIVDAVGGIDAEITQAEINSSKGINFCTKEICENLGLKWKDYTISKPGTQHLNGVQAVAYARIRSAVNVWGTNNDYGRTDRQRYVMEQLFNKATTMGKADYIKLAKSLIPCTETSLSYSEIMSLATSIMLHSPSFEQARIPQTDFLMTSPKGSFGSVVYYDLDYAAEVIHGIIYDDVTLDEYVEANGIKKNDWYASKGSSSVTSSNKTSTSQSSGSQGSSVTSSSKVDEASSTPSSSEGTTTSSILTKPESPTKPNDGNADNSETSGSTSSVDSSSKIDSSSSGVSETGSTVKPDQGDDNESDIEIQ